MATDHALPSFHNRDHVNGANSSGTDQSTALQKIPAPPESGMIQFFNKGQA